MKNIFIISGEVSGDCHSSKIVSELKDTYSFHGLGGENLNKESKNITNWVNEAAVVGVWEVIKKYFYFSKKMKDTINRINKLNPEAVILVDYPGFNLRLAKKLRSNSYKGKIIYYISPQIWAWKKRRLKTMVKVLDLMICIFPFEKNLYESSGLKTKFTGHPIVSNLKEAKSSSIKRRKNLIALLPGSREKEIQKLFPPMLESARLLANKIPDIKFITTSSSTKYTSLLENMIKEKSLEGLFEVHTNNIHEVMQLSTIGIVASGTATLEAAFFKMPYLIVYKVSWITYMIAKIVVTIPFIGIVNILAKKEIIKEILQYDLTGKNLEIETSKLLNNKKQQNKMIENMESVIKSLENNEPSNSLTQEIKNCIEGNS